MITHRILEDYFEEAFRLFAIHSNAEDYAMAFALNDSLNLRLKRSHKDYDLYGNIAFPCFEWKDEFLDMNWHLICNSSSTVENGILGNLFPDEPVVHWHYLVPEFKDADFILRTEVGTETPAEEIISTILNIPHVIAVYEIDTASLKSKENLIF